MPSEFTPSTTAQAAAIALLEQLDPTPAPGAASEATPPAAAASPGEAPAEGEAAPPAPEAAPNAAAERDARLAEQLKAHRERKLAKIQARATKSTVAAQESALAAAQREFDADPVGFMVKKGKDPAAAFADLAQKAREATTPEAKVKALEAQIAAQKTELDKFLTTQQQREKEAETRTEMAQKQAAIRAEEDLFIEHFTPEKYPHARAYLDDDSEMRQVIHSVAKELRTGRRGAPVPFEDIANTIEERAAKHYRASQEKLAKLQQGTGAAAPGPKQQAGASKGNRASSTISNDIAASTASNPSRRRTLAERQREAAALLSSPASAK